MAGTPSPAPETPTALIAAIVTLADACDGAVAEDGVGFNGGDSAFGRSLAAQIRDGRPLTANQARAAAKMLPKYAAQLAAAGISVAAVAVDAAAVEAAAEKRAAPARRVDAALDAAGGRIEIRAPFALKDAIKALPGARWNPTAKVWTIPATNTAAAALADAAKRHLHDFHPAAEVEAMVAAEAATIVEQRAALVGDEATLPEVPTKTAAWTHQRRGYAFALPRTAAMLAMDMGTGKSLTAIGLAEGWPGWKTPRAMRVLVLCPVSVMRVWPREFRIHAARDWNVTVPTGSGTKKAKAISSALALTSTDRPLAVVVNYEAAWRDPVASLLLGEAWDIVICDESHRIKSPNGKASQFAHTLASRANRRLALTGTPMPHSLLDAYAQARFLDEGVFGTSFFRFRHRYAVMGGYEQRQVVAFQHEDEFADRLARLAFQCSAADVLDLPETVDVVRTCDLEPAARAAYRAMEDDFVAETRDGRITAANGGVKVLRLQQITGGVAPVEDPDNPPSRPVVISTAKRDLLKDVLTDLPAGDPVVVFARFTADLDAIREVADELGRSYAEISGNRKDALDDDACLLPGVEVVGVQIQSGGVGIDLTRAAVAVYYSIGHNLGDFQQSLKRTHRPGQKRNVLYVYLVAAGTVDSTIITALRNREEGISAVLAAAKASGSLSTPDAE